MNKIEGKYNVIRFHEKNSLPFKSFLNKCIIELQNIIYIGRFIENQKHIINCIKK